MAASRQLRLLLWKDYLIRKRKPITLIGVLWAILVIMCLFIVRINIDNKDYPTCQFAARALPSAGVLKFLQSFVCNVNNDCSPMNEFEEIPSYEKSKLTQIQRQIAPIFNNETVIDTAATVPDALKLLATLSDIADNPIFLDITRNGLRISDIFRNPKRVKRYLKKQLGISEDVSDSLMTADVAIDGIMRGNLDRCNADSINKTIRIENAEHLKDLVEKLCKLPKKTVKDLVMNLILEVDIGKYVSMVGDMYYKLSGDERIMKIGEMAVAVMRMMSTNSFMPPELNTIIQGKETDFSYVNLTMINTFIDLFQPTFRDTDSFKSLKDVTDTVVVAVQYLNKFLTNKNNKIEEETIESNITEMKYGIKSTIKKMAQFFSSVGDSIVEIGSNNNSFNIMSLFPRITNFVLKFLPANQKHNVLFYSTLLAKLIKGAQKIVNINMHIEQITYNLSLSNPQGVKVLLGLPPGVIDKGLQAIADPERIQIMSSKLNDPSQMFCDVNRIKNFFLVSREEASSLISQLCTDAWKKYVVDLVTSFGIYDVKKNINSMASLFVLETLGKDISDELYTIEEDFEILTNFTDELKRFTSEKRPNIDWTKAFNITDDSEIYAVFKKREYLGKYMLIAFHGALAKEVVSQNPLLEYKIAPFLKNTIIMLDAMNDQLNVAPRDLQEKAKEIYPKIIQTILRTALDEQKTYRTLSTPCADILCHGPKEASLYLSFPQNNFTDNNYTDEDFVATLCNITVAIEKGLKEDSVLGKAIRTIKNTEHSVLDQIDWTQLITGIKKLYKKLYEDYTYVFEYKTFGMDDELQAEVAKMIAEAKRFWFDLRNLNRMLHISIKFGFRFLDILDHGIFDINSEGWTKLKYSLYSATGPMIVMHDLAQQISSTSKNRSIISNLPVTTVKVINNILPNVPYLIQDSVDIIVEDNTDIAPIISLMNGVPAWPCSDSLTQFLNISVEAQTALQSLETIMCLNRDFQEEWHSYLDARNATVFKHHTWNTTDYPDSLFLKFSAAFDYLVIDLDLIKEILQDTFDDSSSTRITFLSALEYSIEAFNGAEKEEILRKFFLKVDTILEAVNTLPIHDSVPLNTLWKEYLNCSVDGMDEDCRSLSRSTWKYSLKFISTTFGNMTEDLYTYFKESNEPNATILEKLGFTRDTGLYMLYDKLPDFMAVLVNSYWDLEFMNQIRRASLTHFWDCDEVFKALNPGPDSPITAAELRHVQSFVCPSLLHWLSMPRGDNKLIDIFTKPQYFFFTLEVGNLTSTYEKAYTKAYDLIELLNEIQNRNDTLEQDISLNTLKVKLENALDIILKFEIKDTDPSYRMFNEINKKHFIVTIYLTRVVAIINKLAAALDNLKISEFVNNTPDEDIKTLESELAIMQRIFKRKPMEAVAFHFDLLTDIVWTNNKAYRITDTLNDFCERLKNKDTSKDIVVELDRVKVQICAKKYDIIYGAVQNVLDDDLEDTRKSLYNIVNTLKDNGENVTDIAAFFNQRKQLTGILKTSIKYAYDLGIPIYLKYLQNNLKHYNVVMTFLTNGNWWTELRSLYNGPMANNFFDNVEQSFDISTDILTHMDKIHLVKLLRDFNVNSTNTFCLPNITLSDYISDSTGRLTTLHRHICDTTTTDLFKELPPLLFAAQGYDQELKMSTEVNYDSLYQDLTHTEAQLEEIKNGPKAPQRPPWVTEERLTQFRKVALDLLSTESLIKISFDVLTNIVDAGTLFVNNSECTQCSQLTSWFKQINLQLYKKQEYDNLLCHIDHMSLEDTYNSLKNDFHWDMMISELISTRNYTKYELNKSLNELLEQIKLHLLEDVNAGTTKLSECLTKNITGNAFGNATLFVKVLGRALRFLRAELPHLQEIPGIMDLSYLKQLKTDVAHNLHAKDALNKYLIDEKEFRKEIKKLPVGDKMTNKIALAEINLFEISKAEPTEDFMQIENKNWNEICQKHDCNGIFSVITKHVNKTLVDVNLKSLQVKEFWRFNFISNILTHMEVLVEHVARILGVVSRVDIDGVVKGNLSALLDTGMQILMDDTLESILYSVYGLLNEVQPLIKDTTLDFDLTAVAKGLEIIHQFKNYLIEEDIKVNVSQIFSKPERIESSLNKLGINNTNFWSIAAPRIQAGYIQVKPLLNQKQGIYRINNFVCQIEDMSKVIIPGNVDVVTLDDIYSAVIEQFCGMEDALVKDVIPVLIENINFDFILQELKSVLLEKLFKASNLTQSAGDNVLSQFGQMASILPMVQDKLTDVSSSLSNEPLLLRMRNSTSFGDMLTESDVLKEAGNMVCGKPFYANLNKLYKTVAQQQDLSAEPEEAQLEALPTDFCRSLYKDIISMQGGKIVWSFIKPLIVGKILYTPPSPAVHRIVEKANLTFAPMVKITNLIHSMADSFSSVDKLSDHREGLTALQNLMMDPQYAEIRKKIIGDVEAPKTNIDGVFDQFGDTKELGSMLKRVSDLLYCVNLNRFKPMRNEHELTLEAARLTMINEFSAGLVFLNMSDTETEIPLNVEYKIRMDIDNTPTTKRLRSYLWTPGPEANFLENMRYFRGFVQIQDIINKAIIDVSIENSRTIQKREVHEEKKREWDVYTQQVPYPCYRKDFFQTSIYESQALLVAFYFSLLFTVCSIVRFIVVDKETGNTMLMSVMGVNLKYYTLSWYIWSFVEMIVTVACITFVLVAGNVLPRSDPSMIFALLFLYGFSVLSFCYMISKLFRSASSAAVCAGIGYLMSFMPFVLILSLEAVLISSLKILVSLSMSSSVCYAFLFIARYEAMGLGAGWGQIWDAPDNTSDMNIAIAAFMVFIDGVIYLLIGLLLDRFFGIKAQSNITNCKATGEKAGVSIINVTKIYDEGSRRAKLALDNVSVELHQGQITTLLGHNGAGKTTLINILTGMLKPTKGHVIVRSDDVSTAGLGVCPQKDVLFEYMTAREHVALYAQLKSGRTLKEVQDEVNEMLRVLCLGEVCDQPVARLSGGTRRRLCVSLAFVARPSLVSLDEPTAGVDPAARRDIWSMIMKLRENRTILLTTHHLDEAELLSDQIIIMHKGQVHTTGSPIDIKRTLGSGYKLTVMYPDKRSYTFVDDSTENEDVLIEEKTKKLLAVTRSVIKNANLVDVNGLEVEINLPFYDTDGVSNNFLEVCNVLEKKESELGYRNFSVDCSSLEQVFFNICQQADGLNNGFAFDINSVPDSNSKSTSASSIKNDHAPLVPTEGPLRGSSWQQFVALIQARYLHYLRNRWLLFLLIVLPSLFITVAMGFSTIRPPADAEISLKLNVDMYERATQFLVLQPSIYSEKIDSKFAQDVMIYTQMGRQSRNWTHEDSPQCKCEDAIQKCDIEKYHDWNRPELMLLPDVETLNSWLVDSQEVYIEKRYAGFSSVIKDNVTHLVAWYNNKGHHALPATLNALHSAILKTVVGDRANITVHTHPLKISKEPLNKDTVYQHIADAGISAMLLIAYSLVSAGGAVYLVTTRRSQEKRLQLLCGVSPGLYWATALLWDIAIIAINMLITAVILEVFHFPVFVARNNLPAICILILFYGYGCAGIVHVVEKLFSEASLATMLLFCGNAFTGLAGIALLLILDIISESEATDNARWVLHKILLLSPQFALGDGLLEIAKNTIQAEVLSQFGMDTYRDPLSSNVVGYHYLALFLVGTVLLLLNLAIEYSCFDWIFARFLERDKFPNDDSTDEVEEAAAEALRVHGALQPLRLRTIGNINAGFVDSEDIMKSSSINRSLSTLEDACSCVNLRKVFGARPAVRALTLGMPPGQCTALLGENGAGKSTTFSMLTGQLRPTSGKIYLHSREVSSRDLCQGFISYCPQSDAIDPLLTVAETLKLYCRLRGITGQKEVIRRTQDLFELGKYSSVRSGYLSGGNKRKLCAAIAFMSRATLVLLDEPTSGMDPSSRACVSRGVRAACGAGRGALLATHALDDARRLAERVALLKDGQLCALAPLDECLRRFGGGYVVSCRTRSRSPRTVWRAVRNRAPHAQLRVLHHAAMHFLLPTQATVEGKEVTTSISDIFRLMSELQTICDIEDYTVNQSSLDQMFLSFTERTSILDNPDEHAETPYLSRRLSEELDSITSL